MRLLTLSRLPAALIVGLLACKGSAKDEPAVPAKPTNGSPISAEFVKFTEGERRGIEVRLYNHGDAPARGYILLAKYKDKSGATLKVKAGTPFEKDHDFTSASGGRYQVEPKKWTTIAVDMFEVPADAAGAELVISKVDGADGAEIWSQTNWSDWPTGDAK